MSQSCFRNALIFKIGFNYFLIRKFSVSGGFEVWTGNDNNSSLVLGMRWYPLKKIFTRFRGLVGENDIAIGHRRVYTLPLLLQHLEEVGLKTIHISGIFIKPLPGAVVCKWNKRILEGLDRLSHNLPPEYASELFVEVAP